MSLLDVLTHEYPDNQNEIIDRIRLAIKAFDVTVSIIENIKKHNEKTD